MREPRDANPQWPAIQQAVAASYAAEPATWAAFARCPALELHTAAAFTAAEPAGWTVALAGFTAVRALAQTPRPPPAVRLHLAAALPAGPDGAPAGARRATLAAVVAGLATLGQLGRLGWKGRQVLLWYAPGAGTRDAADADLWTVYDDLHAGLRWVVPGELRLEMLPGAVPRDVGPDPTAPRNGQAAGRRAGPADPPAPPDEPAPAIAPEAGQGVPAEDRLVAPAATASTAPPAGGSVSPAPAPEPDYTLIILAPDNPAPDGVGRYGLRTRDGRQRLGQIPLADVRHPDEGEYRTLLAVLTALTERIARERRQPRHYRLRVRTARASVIGYLGARHAGPVAGRPPGARAARAVLARFGAVELVPTPAAEIAILLAEDAAGGRAGG